MTTLKIARVALQTKKKIGHPCWMGDKKASHLDFKTISHQY